MKTDWLILAYLAADNDLEGKLLDDLREMERVGSQPGAVEILAQIDRARGHDRSAGNWTGTRRYHVTKSTTPDVIGSPLLADLGETNTGAPGVLADFIAFGATQFPSRATMLVLSTHGYGVFGPGSMPSPIRRRPSRGLAYDVGSIDCLDNRELTQALAGAHTALGRPVDIVGMDACYMTMVEVAYQLREHARILVGSQEIEPLEGWPHAGVLGDLVARPTMTAHELATTIVRRYVACYAGGKTNATQSAIDLGKLNDLVTAIDRLARVLLGALPSPSLELALFTAWRRSLRFFGGLYVDLHDFAGHLRRATSRDDVKRACVELQDVIESNEGPIIAEQHVGPHMAPASGLSIYFPPFHDPTSIYRELDFARRTRWADFLDAYLGAANPLAAH